MDFRREQNMFRYWMYITLLLSQLLSFHCEAKNTRIIVYGTHNAAHYNGRNATTYFISLGSFTYKTNAMRFFQQLTAKGMRPLNVSKLKKYYWVSAGPFYSIKKMNDFGKKWSIHNEPLKPITSQRSSFMSRSGIMTGPSLKHTKRNVINKSLHQPQRLRLTHWTNGRHSGSAKQLQSRAQLSTLLKKPLNRHRYVSTLSLGVAAPFGNNDQTFFLAPEVEKKYSSSSPARRLLDVEYFLGVEKQLQNCTSYQIGLAVAVASPATMKGTISDDALPEFENYTYQYKLRHEHVAIKGKLLFTPPQKLLIPWISASLGLGLNQSTHFTNTPIIYEAIASPNFTNRQQTALSYTLGLGLQSQLTNNWQTGLGYEFADWGASGLDRASTQTMNSGLSRPHFYTNAILVNLTFHK